MCLSLLAQGYDCVKAAQTAVYAHGIAASKCETNYGLTPSKLISLIKNK
jgi:NAD(P)H-hydrate repair Nnr-like enzyme with NAD(P)H-hydrate dehydratase domain